MRRDHAVPCVCPSPLSPNFSCSHNSVSLPGASENRGLGNQGARVGWRPGSVPPQVPVLAERWWPWASGPLATVPAPWLWPGLPPYPTRCPTTFQTSMVTQPLSRNHTPRKIPAPRSKSPLPLYSILFSLRPQCCHLFLQQQLRRLQTAACQQRLYQGREPGQPPGSLSTHKS